MTWCDRKLGELISLKHGYAFRGEHFREHGPHLVLTPGNVHPFGGLKLNPGKDAYYVGRFPEEFLLRRGDLFIVMTDLTQTAAILGGAALIDRDNVYLHNQRLGLVRIKNPRELNRTFLLHYLNWQYFRDQVKASSNGSTVRHTSPGRIYRCRIRLPDLAVQQKIAGLLTTYDDLIENNKRRIALLEKMAEEIYREWFVRLRFPGHVSGSARQRLPAGWAMLPANEVLDILSGGTPKTDVPEFWDGPIPFFTPGDAGDAVFAFATEKTITEKGLTSCNSPLYPDNTIFITARGTVGKVVLSAQPMAMNQSCYALRPKARLAEHYYFFAVRNSVDYIKGISKSGVFSNIVIDTFKHIPILKPDNEALERFERLIGPKMQLIKALAHQSRLLQQARDLLLPRLISGKLRVDHLDGIQFPPSMRDAA